MRKVFQPKQTKKCWVVGGPQMPQEEVMDAFGCKCWGGSGGNLEEKN